MASNEDPHTGGSLSDMAVSGTSVPNDAGKHNLIPSVPRPDQTIDPANDPNNLGARDLAAAADNSIDYSRSTKDTAPAPEVITGTGDALPAEVTSKRLHYLGNPDLSKGHDRYDKHVRQKGSDVEHGASEGAAEEEVVDGVVGGR